MPYDPEMMKWFETQWKEGKLTRPSAALNQLKTNPLAFLQRYPLQNNFDCSVSGLTTAYIMNNAGDKAALRPGSILGTLRMHATESFNLQNLPGPSGDGQSFNVHGVHMDPSDSPIWYTLTIAADIMLTAKLTGCTFIARATGDGVEVTHLQPHNETGLELNQRANVPGQQAYGRLKYDIDSRSINVVGVRTGTRWNIYAQKIDKHSLTIRSVHRIFPPE